MSSAQNNVLGSTVFQQTLLACGAFVAVSLALLWLICGAFLWQISGEQTRVIRDLMTAAQGMYDDGGTDALIAYTLEDGEGELWPEDYIYELLEEEETLWVLRTPNYDPIAGYAGLYGDEGWETTTLDHPEIDTPLRALTVRLDGDETLTVAKFETESARDIWGFASFATIALLMIVLPLALITGYVLSQRVFRRIETISHTAAAVASGHMTSRAGQSPRHDEFDRLAGGINHMLDRVETLNANIEAVSVGVAHDLRTPLTNIGGRLELIRRDKTNPDAIDTHVDAAEEAQSQLMRVFDALLRLGEVKAGRRKSAFKSLDLSALVSTMADAYEPLFVDANKGFSVGVQPGLTVTGDAELLEQMMANLLENAIEHSRDAAQVFVTLNQTGPLIELRIGDDGPGISPNDRDRIFERFYRADRSRSTPGNGLGLSLVKAIAELHEADITLDPSARGAVFVLQIKAAA